MKKSLSLLSFIFLASIGSSTHCMMMRLAHEWEAPAGTVDDQYEETADDQTSYLWNALCGPSAEGYGDYDRKHAVIMDAIREGADVNAECNGQYALHVAIQKQPTTTVAEALIKAGAQPDLIDSTSNTALHYALKSRDYHLIKLFLEREDTLFRNQLRKALDIKNEAGQTPRDFLGTLQWPLKDWVKGEVEKLDQLVLEDRNNDELN